MFLVVKTLNTVQSFLSVNIKDSFCNKHCRISLHDVGGKLVQSLDLGVGWGWGNLHGNGNGEFLWRRGGDGENFMVTGWGWGKFYGDGNNFIYRVTLYYIPFCSCFYLSQIKSPDSMGAIAPTAKKLRWRCLQVALTGILLCRRCTQPRCTVKITNVTL